LLASARVVFFVQSDFWESVGCIGQMSSAASRLQAHSDEVARLQPQVYAARGSTPPTLIFHAGRDDPHEQSGSFGKVWIANVDSVISLTWLQEIEVTFD
jgi:hypothetical protein